MQEIIPHTPTRFNNYFNPQTTVTRLTTRNLSLLNSSDTFSRIQDAIIAKGIEQYYRGLNKPELEFIKYLNYFHKKYDGRIALPIKNLMERFKCSARWVHKVLRRMYEQGWLVTSGGGFGRKVTVRSFTARGKMLMKAIVSGFGSVKQDIPKKCADYCADYSGGHSNYISTQEDILKKGEAKKPFEKTPESEGHAKSALEIMRKMLKLE